VFEITGGELMDVPQQVDILARILGKSIRCVDVPAENVVPSLIRAGIPSQIAPAVAQTFEDVRKGRGAMITDTIERVTGHPPMTFEAWARKHASRFM
jgi:hypothetical protein